MKIKFKNTDVNIKKLVQGAVVLYEVTGFSDPEIFHIHKFACFNGIDNSVDLIVVDDEGKWDKNSADLTWPI